jgi:hypothetical protein
MTELHMINGGKKPPMVVTAAQPGYVLLRYYDNGPDEEPFIEASPVVAWQIEEGVAIPISMVATVGRGTNWYRRGHAEWRGGRARRHL